MFVTSVCAYLRVGGEQLGVCTIDFDVCVGSGLRQKSV